jgi:hypothetical protein
MDACHAASHPANPPPMIVIPGPIVLKEKNHTDFSAKGILPFIWRSVKALDRSLNGLWMRTGRQ